MVFGLDVLGQRANFLEHDDIGVQFGQITKTKIASEIDVPASEIEALLFGLANMLSIDGMGGTTPRKVVSLKVVK